MKEPVRCGIGAWVYLVLFGVLVGSLAGLLESLLEAARGESIVGMGDVSTIALFYGLMWGGLGAVCGAAALAVSCARRKPLNTQTVKAVLAPFLLCALLFVWVGGYVNIRFLPTMFSPGSLLFDACWFLCCAALWWLLSRRLRRRVGQEQPLFRLRSPLAAAFLGVCLVLIGVSLLARTDPLDPLADRGDASADLNILLLLLDALRPDHLSCNGYPRPTTPNIDRLASEGVLFERAYANAPLTKESSATLMTSLFPSTHNVRRLADGLPHSAVTLMEAIQAAGYRTAIFSANPMVSPLFGFGRGVDHFYSQRVPLQDQTVLVHILRRLGTAVPGMQWMNDLVAAGLRLLPTLSDEPVFSGGSPEDLNHALLTWLDGGVSAPFFAYLHYMVPHAPYDPPAPFDGYFVDDDPGTRITNHPPYGVGMLPFVEGKRLSEEERRALVLQYDRNIAYGDAQVGDLLARLDERGILDNTLVIVTADHGEEFYEHRGWGHGQSLFEELVRVPLIFWRPGVVHAGRRVDRLAQVVDLMPTLIGAAGASPEKIPELEGVNLWPAIRDNLEIPSRDWVFCEVFHGSHFARALIDGHWKVIYARHDRAERVMVFDLLHDSAEQRDLAEASPDVREALLSRMDDFHRELLAKQRQISVRQIDSRTMERLRSLGYVQ